jgi:glycosyltransferase involved in cell wall biosynthesis
MKVVHLSTSDSGGAGIAASRIHAGLLQEGVESSFVSLYKYRNDIPKAYSFFDCLSAIDKVAFQMNRVYYRLGIKKHPYFLQRDKYLADRPQGFELFSIPYSTYDVTRLNKVQDADIVHLHWVTEGFVDYASFFRKINKKIVWTLHDMNPFTGGCHHSDECVGFTGSCNHCPQLKGTFYDEFASDVLMMKSEALAKFSNESINIVSPSNWMMEKSKKSTLFNRFPHYRIVNPVDDTVFYPRNKKLSREMLGLPSEKKILLFIAKDVENIRKGVRYLVEAVSAIKEVNNLLVCSVGNLAENKFKNTDHINLGYVTDQNIMAMIYSAADIFVLPSLAENFPNTICEALQCGTPVVAFDIGGVPDLINFGNGILAAYRDKNELKSAIEKILLTPDNYSSTKISEDAKALLSLKDVTGEYINVYEKMLN